jgi:tetratricopeptide (TPR) repeat protein
MTTRRRLLSLLAVSLVLGCGSSKGSAVHSAESPKAAAVASDEPKWIRIQSEHFDLSTDLEESDAFRAAEALENERSAIISALWHGNSERAATRTSAVVFQDGLEFAQFFDGVTALFVALPRPTVILWGKPEHWKSTTGVTADATSSVLRHELTHRLASSLFAQQPKWFAEGLAQFVETLTVSADGKTATLGEADPEALNNYWRFRTGVSDALEWKSIAGVGGEKLQGLYGVSWLLVHYLVDKRSDGFEAFQRALASGVDPNEAWKNEFGSLRPIDLDRELREYAQRRSFKKVVIPIELRAVQPAKRTAISEAEVHAIRAQVALVAAGTGVRQDLIEEANKEIERAVALEPANALAVRLLLLMGKQSHVGDLGPRLRTQIAKRPDDGDAWLLLAEFGEPAERETAARKAVALMPDNPDACIVLANHLAATGRADEALPLATKAATLAPWNVRAHDAIAAALFGAGRCPDAIRAESQAIEVLPEAQSRSSTALELRRKLEGYRRACGKQKVR